MARDAGVPACDPTAVIRVLVVDDQRFMRIALRQIIESDGDMRVVGEARDGVEALAMARELTPDAVTMDVEMPQMDGVTACASIMREVTPKPAIIMVSAHTQAGAESAVSALRHGAVDFVSKSSSAAATDLAQIDTQLRQKLRAWSRRGPSVSPTPPAPIAPVPPPAQRSGDLVAIAASTGGPQALTALLKALGPIAPPIVVALHMPGFFTASLTQLLSQDTGCAVVEGRHGAALLSGTVVLVPGGRDGVVARRRGGGYELRLVTVQANVHPSGDALLESAALVAQAPVGVVLTGMGQDGARGAAALHRRQSPVLVQDPATCVVDGMPRSAMAAVPTARVMGLHDIASTLAQWCARPGPGPTGRRHE